MTGPLRRAAPTRPLLSPPGSTIINCSPPPVGSHDLMKSTASLARSVAFPRVLNIDDLRRLARRRLPAVVFAYIDGGAEDEMTLRDNCRAFSDIAFRPRQCVAVPACDLRTRVLGTDLDLPFLLAPVGFCRMFYPRGEVHAARAAHDAGTAYILSTFSGTRLEEVRAGAGGPLWYQLYVPGGRAVAEATLARAKTAGYSVLVVTIDTPVSGMRERDFRHGVRPLLQGDVWGSLPHAWQFVRRPRWVLDFLADGAPRVFPNVELPGIGSMPCGDVGALLESTIVTWDDLRWMRSAWNGPFVVKGVHTGDDARRAIDAGADALVVSNHGGRQLDGVPGSLRALPEVVAAVDGQIEVLMDGGIRRGADVVKALCLGATAVLVGRAYAWGLGAAGGPGVSRAIEILRADIVRTMRLLGCASVRDLDRSYLEPVAQHHGLA
jgi:isopentenyl diphosphate isomerase/L-lactate dehydrogenase-like FMN-dependent dehydrogenase